MRTPSEILKYYIQAIEQLSGASSVSLYVPDPLGDGGRALLLKAGNDCVPELTSIETARKFADAQPNDGASGPLAALIPETMKSSDSDGMLIPLRALNQEQTTKLRGFGLKGATQSEPPTGSEGMKSWWQWVLELGEAITRDIMRVSGVLNDPVSGLPGRAEFFQTVDKALKAGAGPSTAMLILSPITLLPSTSSGG